MTPSRWQPGPVHCCNCERPLTVARSGDAITAGAGVLPAVPGAVCETCLPLAAGPVLADLRAPAAVHILLAQEFERGTPEAVQALLDLYGLEPEVVAAGARRLHADGAASEARDLLETAAATADDAGFFLVEQAALRLLDGDLGGAHELLLETAADEHPRWHLLRGNLAHAVGHADAAREHWRAQVQESPEEPLGWQTLGWHLLHERQDAAAAAACFTGACGIFPQHQEFRAWLGEALLQQGKPEEALAALEHARGLQAVDPDFAAGLEERIGTLRRTLDTGEQEPS